ncbi:MAG: GTPase, partial [Rivularia sp. ALOHA_DT_140]|nr:GTPase [Rivularia sp. ALOHA_DT_140]
FVFVRLKFNPYMALNLYGTPGQERFNFIWDMLIRKAHAYILLVAAHRPGEFRYARRVLSYMNQRAQIPMIIGLTHADCSGAWTKENIIVALGYYEANTHPPIVIVNPTETSSVANAVISLVQHYVQSNATNAMVV